MNLRTIIILCFAFGFLGCGDDGDGTGDFPIHSFFTGPIENKEVFILTLDEDNEEINIPPDSTNLDEANELQNLETDNSFSFFCFLSEDEAQFQFRPGFSTTTDTINFVYIQQSDRLIFNTTWISVATALNVPGQPENLTVESQAVYWKNADGSINFFVNPFRALSTLNLNEIALGDTVVVMNYVQRYQN